MTRANDLRCLLLAPALALGASIAVAQTDVAGQLAAAGKSATWPDDLAQLFAQAPLGKLVDALVPQQDHLADKLPWVVRHGWRRDGAIELWRSEPERRRARARVLALLELPWAVLFAAADAGERADIEAVAQHLLPTRIVPWLRSEDEAQRQAAETLMRIAVPAERARRACRTGADLLAVLLDWHSRGSPFALSDVLADPDQHVRARAVMVLRWMLGLDLPPCLVTVLVTDPEPLVRNVVTGATHGHSVLTDVDANATIQVLATDPDSLLGNLVATLTGQLANARRLSPKVRAALAKAWIAVGLRAPLDANPVAGNDPVAKPGVPVSRDFGRAATCFANAARLGAGEYQTVLALAINAGDVQVARRALAGLVDCGVVPVAAAVAAAPLVTALLDHADPAVAASAVVLAARVLAANNDPVLRAKVAGMALAILAKDAASLSCGPDEDDCRWVGPMQFGPPVDTASRLVLAAARAGDARLLDPLIAELQRLLAADPAALGDFAGAAHATFVMQCLELLVDRVTAAQARRLHDLLLPGMPAPARQPLRGSLARDIGADVLCSLYAVVPADLLPQYDALLTDPENLHRFAKHFARCFDALSDDRVRRILKVHDGADPFTGARYRDLYLRFPEQIVEAWRAGGERREAAIRTVANAMYSHLDRVLALVAAGTLPRELALVGYLRSPREAASLPTFALLLPAGDADSAVWGPLLAEAISQPRPATSDADLAALGQLASSPVNLVALAAVRAAAPFGPRARDLRRAALPRLLMDLDLRFVMSALGIAVEHGIEPAGLPDLLRRVRTSKEWDGNALADAAQRRFAGTAASTCEYVAKVVTGQVDVELEELRKSLGRDAAEHWCDLLSFASPGTRVSALQLVGEQDRWTEAVEKRVLTKTSDQDPRVRRAAYAALRTRDPDLWPCAWLVHEAVFDPDPLVREFAQQLR